MGSTLSTDSEKTNMPKKTDEKQKRNPNNQKQQNPDDLPSIFVNKNLLLFDDMKYREVSKVYEIDGKMYKDNIQDVGEFKKFKLFAQKVFTKDIDTETDTESVDSAKKFEIDVKLFEHGYVINSMVYLSEDNYHTKVAVADDYYNCFVCDQIVYVEDDISHIYDDDHIINMALYAPLEDYGLSIVRLRQDQYHCGVCNVVFHKNVSEQHFNGQNHNENLLSATKIATDKYKINDMHRNKKNDSRNIVNDTNKNTLSIKVFSEKKNVMDNVKNNDVIRNEKNDTRNKNNDRDVTEDENKNATSKEDVTIILGNKQFNISFYSWNMISISKSKINNKFYCMACKSVDSLEQMESHISNTSHENCLKQFKLTKIHLNHVFRQDEKFAHCSTCNVIIPFDGIDIHLSTKHIKGKISLENTSMPEKKPIENEHVINSMENAILHNPNINKTGMENTTVPTNSSIINTHSINEIMKQRVIIFLFGFKISVLMLSLNLIFRNESAFYCGICKCNIPLHCIYFHMRDPIHITLLNSIPAIVQYGYNYIRSIQNVPHCGICHMVIPQPHLLINHVQSPAHLQLTNFCLGLAVPQSLIVPQQPTAVPNAKSLDPNVNNEAQNLEYKTPDPEYEIQQSEIKLDYGATNKEDVAQNTDREDPYSQAENPEFDKKYPVKSQDSKSRDTKVYDAQNVTQFADDVFGKNGNNEKKNESNDSIKMNDCDILENNDFEYTKEQYAILEKEIAIMRVNAKITLLSYNTLVPNGDGHRYCFVCAKFVKFENLEKHINHRDHIQLLNNFRYVVEYASNLIRQKSVLYHCALCNTILRRSEIKYHLDWSIHKQQRYNMTLKDKIEEVDCVKIKFTTEKRNENEKETEIKFVSSDDRN